MSYSKEDILKLIGAGTGLVLNGGGMSKEDLMEIASVVLKRDSVLTLKNVSHLSIDDLVEVAQAGGDALVMEV